MRLEKASAKAVRYAIMKWHYSKSVPGIGVAYSVFEQDEWAGVVTFSIGANKNIGRPFGLNGGRIAELTRVALNGKQKSTSKAIALSLRLLKKDAPLLQLVVSYADKGQKHTGIVYQASNWFFIEETKTSGLEVYANGRWMHKRSYDSYKIPPKVISKRYKPGKYKYIYPLDKSLIPMCEKMSKPYPK